MALSEKRAAIGVNKQAQQLKDLIARGKEQGFLTYAEVNDHLPNDIVDPEQIEELLKLAAARVAPGGKLVIRSGLKDESFRFKVTVAGDFLAKATFWMKDAPIHYPTAEDFRSILSPFGLVTITPLWGKTPFNNHLIVLNKE